ncbi:F-box protein At3g17710-like [Brassica rapa]|uniref:F-box protein At3g17710-like n=1 Tax=Brassica campestris TaxID=3711 RepID=UPI00142E8F1E|nr:F-box protein At3g17710-like [Brassica rapa]
MAQTLKQLPWELEENILSRLPPPSLVRLRTVCQRWNALFNDKSFVNDHFSRSRPGFLFLGSPKTIPCLWNPWLSQFKVIKKDGAQFNCCGLGYEIIDRTNKVYKILGYFDPDPEEEYTRVAVYECASHVFKHIDLPENKWFMSEGVRDTVSLKGNLYWFSLYAETDEYFIRSFDFSVATFKPFCLLPCQKDDDNRDELLLQVFKEDRFSLLKQNYLTRKIEIWVTNTIYKEEVVWTKMMNLPTTNFPRLFEQFYGKSYFIYDKTLFVCCCENSTSVPCIYIVREDLCKQIHIDSGIFQCCHCVYTPSLFPVP